MQSVAVCRCFKNHCRAECLKYLDKRRDCVIQNPKPQYGVWYGELKERDVETVRIILK